jgi:hypothetical protein
MEVFPETGLCQLWGMYPEPPDAINVVEVETTPSLQEAAFNMILKPGNIFLICISNLLFNSELLIQSNVYYTFCTPVVISFCSHNQQYSNTGANNLLFTSFPMTEPAPVQVVTVVQPFKQH